MSLLDDIIKQNNTFIEKLPENYLHRNDDVSKYPEKELAIYTCMDTRLVEFLEPAMGIKRGQAKIIKAAGNMVTGPFDEVIRSLMVAVYELGVKEIAVVGHEDCGMMHSTSQSLKTKMLDRGISPDAIKFVEKEFISWVDAFSHPHDNVKNAVEAIRNNSLLPRDVPVHGLIFCPKTGKIEIIVNGYQNN